MQKLGNYELQKHLQQKSLVHVCVNIYQIDNLFVFSWVVDSFTWKDLF